MREGDVILACLHPPGREGDARIRDLLRGPVDWPCLQTAAEWHGVLPFVYRRLGDVAPDLVPRAAVVALQSAFAVGSRRNLFLAGELLRLLNLLQAQGVSGVPYKGPTLAVVAHGDLTRRDFTDNDIMIRRRDFAPAHDLLAAEGYRPEFSIPAAHREAYLRSRHSLAFMDDRGSIIELHWGFQPAYFSFDLDPEMLLSRLQPVRLAGGTTATFSREDLLLILTLHGAKHLWGRLQWISDVAALSDGRTALDWDRVLTESARLGTRRCLLLGLHLAGALLEADLPVELRYLARRNQVVAALAGRVQRQLFARRAQPGLLEASTFFLGARERWSDKVRYCVRLATTPYVRDWEVVHLPGATSSLYYIIRPFRMIHKYAAAAVHQLRTSP